MIVISIVSCEVTNLTFELRLCYNSNFIML